MSLSVTQSLHNKGWNPEPGKSDIEIGHKILMSKVTFLL